jgi:hypothetical protein
VAIKHFTLLLALILVSSFSLFGQSGPPPPDLQTPIDGTMGVSTSLTLTWNSNPFATSYHLQVSTSSNFSTTIYDVTGITGTSYAISGLTTSTTYYWRVCSNGTGGDGGYPSPRSFTTGQGGGGGGGGGVPAAPTLSSPADGATGVSLSTTLSWVASSGASTYGLQVSTSSSFSTTVFDQSSISSTSQQVTGLSASTVYYWRVNATNSSGTGSWSSARSFTTTSSGGGGGGSAPTAPTLSSPADGATGVSLTTTLSWNASSGAATYGLQVSASSSFSTTVYDQSNLSSTSQQVTGLSASTVYYWRVNAVNTTGTSSWSSTRSFTTAGTAPSAPTLSSPSDSATSQSTSPTLNWAAVTGATSYSLQVSTSYSFSSTVYDQSNLTSTSQQVTGLSNNSNYYWRVNATSSGGTSNWSTIRIFTTVAAAPLAPTLAAPADTAKNVSLTPTLSWNAVTGATTYHVQVSISPGFATVLADDSTLTGTSKQASGLTNNTLYYWRVRAKNAGGWGSYSTARSFTTVAAVPATPTPAAPADTAKNVSLTPTLSWNAVTGAATYHVQVSISSGFVTTLVDDSTLTVTSKQLSGLLNNTAYYWRVRAKNAGGWGSYSTAQSFTTVAAVPAAPTLAVPADTAKNVSLTPTLSWNAVTGATTYHVQVSISSGFATVLVDDSTQTGTSKQVSGLANGTPHYWRVRGKNAGGWGAYSTARMFTTVIAVAAAPTLASPADAATGIGVSPTLSWNAATGAASYCLQVSTSNSFASTVFDQANLTGTSQQITGLANYTQYFWRVSATNVGGTSGWSTIRSFTTIDAVLSAPTLSSPTDGATGVSKTPTLSWNAVTGATSYQVQVSTSSSFASFVVDQSGITGTSYNLTGLSDSTVYYWKVSASNAAGAGSASATRSFRTAGAPPAGPAAPTLQAPANGATGIDASPTLSWNAVTGASSYRLQVSTSNTFSATVFDQPNLAGTSKQVTGLANNTPHYWRVNATNAAGTSAWSTTGSFTTMVAGGPPPPDLQTPLNGTAGVPTNLTLTWNIAPFATSYHLQVSTNPGFTTTAYDVGGITSTSYGLSGLAVNTTYYWRVSSNGAGGEGAFSSARSFKTTAVASAVETMLDERPNEFQLTQNYPNPFNPTTTISYGLPEAATVSLKVFSTSGQLVSVLVDGFRHQGCYQVSWKADVPSGVYFYRLQAGSYVETKRMILLR